MTTKIILLLILLAPGIALATEHNLEGEIKEALLCDKLEFGDTVIIKSPGGSLRASLFIAGCIRQKNITVKLYYGYSGAAIVTLAANNVCLILKDSKIGFHTPYYKDEKGLITELTPEDTRSHLRLIIHLMVNKLGYKEDEALAVVGLIALNGPNQMGILEGANLSKLLGKRFKGMCE